MDKSDFVDYVVHDLMRDIDGVSSKAMFGGHGLYLNDKIFGMIVDDVVYLKVNKDIKCEFEQLGSKPFTYQHKSGKQVAMSYYELPQPIADDSTKLRNWVERSASA